MTMPTGDTGIPEFFARMVEPYVRAKQAEAVVQGATDAIAGRSIKDIAKGDSGIARIFGPTGYHQGAAAFAATSAWAKAKSDILSNPDLEKMAPDQLGAFLSQQYQGMMTGDHVTDRLLSHTLLQDHAPLVATLSARHEAYVQRQALGNWSNTLDGNASSLQTIMSQPGDLNSPTLAAGRNQAVGNYLASLQKPHGMSDEVWQGGLASHAHAALTGGNFYAFEALKQRGLYSALTDDQQAKLDTSYQTAASRALGMVSADPEISQRLAALDMQIRTGIKVGAAASPNHQEQRMSLPEIDAAVAQINQLAAQKTGIAGRQLISGDDLNAMHKEFNSGVFQAGLRVQEHQWQREREDRDHAWDIQKDEYKQAEGLRLAATAAGAGNVSPSLATGTIKETDVNAVFGQAVQGGNFGLLAHNFQNGRYVNSYAAQQLQSPITNSVGIGVTAGFKQAYTQWQALHNANPAAAVAYYGDHAAKLEGYDKAIRGGETDLAAYAQTFGRGPDLDKVPLPDGVKMKDAHAAVQEAITAQDAGWISSGRTKLSPSANNVVAGWLMAKAGAYARASGVSIDQAASKLYAAGLASGEIERAGPFAWTNPQGAKKLGSYLGLPDDATDRLVTSAAGDKLKRAGFSQGTNGSDYVVLRVDGGSGQPALYVQAFRPDRSGYTDVLLTMPELRAANRRVIEAGTNKEAARQRAAKPVTIDVSSEGVAARRNSYQHAMDQDGPTIDIGPPIGDALYGALDIVGTSRKTGDLIIGAADNAARGAVGAMRRQFHSTIPEKGRRTR